MKGSRGMWGKRWFYGILIAAVLAAALGAPVANSVLKLFYPLAYGDKILACADKYGVDAYLILALIKAESSFEADAHSKKDARGLMQITDGTGKWVAEQMGMSDYSFGRLSDPNTNIEMGVWYLDYLLSRCNGDVELALCAYNAGIGNIGKWLSDARYSSDGSSLHTIPFADTRAYVENTRKYRIMYQRLYPKFAEQGQS